MMDETVIPSFMSTVDRGYEDDSYRLNNTVLRIGEVKKIVYPDDDKSVSKKFVEYAVEVVVKDGSGPPTTTIYVGCVLQNLFGGWADKLRYTLREDTQNNQQSSDNIYGIGSKVLILCANGDTDNALIMGGVPDVGTKEDQKEKDEGHNLFFEFNGVQVTINKDGELKLMFRGATKNDGELDDNAVEEAEGSYVQINKDGNIKVASPEDKQIIEINHKDSKITIKSDKKVVVACDKINLGEEDPSDALALASKCMTELKKLQSWQKKMKSTFGSHKHIVTGIATAGSPVAQSQTAPVPTQAPLTPADEPESVDDVKSEVVLAK